MGWKRLSCVLMVLLLVGGCSQAHKAEKAPDLSVEIVTAAGGGDQQQGVLRYRFLVANPTHKAAEAVHIRLVLHPEIAKRVKATNQKTEFLAGTLAPAQTYGVRNGIVVFDGRGLRKQDIAQFKPLLSLQLTWRQGGKTYHKTVNK